jgi:hypothetical protein
VFKLAFIASAALDASEFDANISEFQLDVVELLLRSTVIVSTLELGQHETPLNE